MITRAFAYNPQFSPANLITGTIQHGDLAIAVDSLDYSSNPGGVTWWMGPNEEPNGVDRFIIIAAAVPTMDFPTQIPDGFSPDFKQEVGTVQFWGADNTEAAYLQVAQVVTGQVFADAAAATAYFADTSNGFWCNVDDVTLI
jgi:hypothetical protein